MKRFVSTALLSLSICFTAGGASAAPNVSRDEVPGLVKEAIQYMKKNGRPKAFAEFNNPNGQFTRGEFYIVVATLDGVVLSHGSNPRLIGKDIHEIKDMDGKLFVQDQIKMAKEKGNGWIEFRAPNPVSKLIEEKTVYMERADDVMVTGGIYKEKK
ncbi:MAG: cache domain-containing protein [Pseudomonadota bacterium]